jgi:pilus assembly protein TadC
MSKPSVPFMPFPLTRTSRRLLNGLCPAGAAIKPLFPGLDRELEATGNSLSAIEYLAGTLITAVFYFVVTFVLMLTVERFLPQKEGLRMNALMFGFIVAAAVMAYSVLLPKLHAGRGSGNIDRNLLFVTRHLMIQTSAGVPLFESIVSIAEKYNDPMLDYGAFSVEFEKIAKEVRGGKELTQALEDSAARINSNDYRQLMWQLANANKAGANIGYVLRQMMSYLSDEQRIRIRDYGSQLSPLAIFYMLVCIIAPTMGVIFLVIISTLANIGITSVLLGVGLMLMLVCQIVFIGLIKSKRPVVAV